MHEVSASFNICNRFYRLISYNLRSAASNNKISSREGKTYVARGSSMALAAFPASEASSSHPLQSRSHSNSHNSGKDRKERNIRFMLYEGVSA